MDIRGHLEKNKFEKVLTKKLTSREVQVLSLYATGFTVKEVSDVLVLSESTVRTHINNIFSKVLIDSSADVKLTLCLLWHIYNKQLTKMGGYKKCKKRN